VQSQLMNISNAFMKTILGSPLHGLVSGSVMLITFTGRKSGKIYTTPVNYVRDGESLIILSQDDRTWWKNLRGGVPVAVRLQGKELKGISEVFEDPEAVAQGLITLMQQSTSFQKYLGIELHPDGRPRDPDALMSVAQTKVIVRITDLRAEQV
jgi:deazaflavin-dependent oxidoreductase (nitroreductase family)